MSCPDPDPNSYPDLDPDPEPGPRKNVKLVELVNNSQFLPACASQNA
jgi:hypothetical protein